MYPMTLQDDVHDEALEDDDVFFATIAAGVRFVAYFYDICKLFLTLFF